MQCNLDQLCWQQQKEKKVAVYRLTCQKVQAKLLSSCVVVEGVDWGRWKNYHPLLET
jgi:hypothetical protein